MTHVFMSYYMSSTMGTQVLMCRIITTLSRDYCDKPGSLENEMCSALSPDLVILIICTWKATTVRVTAIKLHIEDGLLQNRNTKFFLNK